MYKATLTQNKWLNSKKVVAVKTLKGNENSSHCRDQEMLHVPMHGICSLSILQAILAKVRLIRLWKRA